MNSYIAVALWPEGQIPAFNDLVKQPFSKEKFAKDMCQTLENAGWAGERKVFPVKTWIEYIDAN